MNTDVAHHIELLESELAEANQEIEVLKKLANAAEAFVNHVPPDDCTKDNWYDSIEKFVIEHKRLLEELKETLKCAKML